MRSIRRLRAVAGVSSDVTGGRSVLTSAAVGGGAPSPPKRSRGGNREGAPSPTRSCARSDQAGASEPKKSPLEQRGRDKERVNFDSFRKLLSAPLAGEATPQRAIRVIYGSVAASKAPHLHAGPCGSRCTKGCSDARGFAAPPAKGVFSLIQRLSASFYGTSQV